MDIISRLTTTVKIVKRKKQATRRRPPEQTPWGDYMEQDVKKMREVWADGWR